MKVSSNKLRTVFEKVQNKEHWKNPIDAFINPDEYGITDSAIGFFTGTHIKFAEYIHTGPNKGKIHIKADGYYAGPCN